MNIWHLYANQQELSDNHIEAVIIALTVRQARTMMAGVLNDPIWTNARYTLCLHIGTAETTNPKVVTLYDRKSQFSLKKPPRPQVTVWREDESIVASRFPKQPGMPIQGSGKTVLEAIGSLCIFDQIVELGEPCEEVDKCWSATEKSPPRR